MNKLIANTRVLGIIKNDTVNQAAKYLVVGGLCTVIDFSLLFCLPSILTCIIYSHQLFHS